MKELSKRNYSLAFAAPAVLIFSIFFLVPVISSLYYSLTVWDFQSSRFVGLENYRMFLTERSLNTSIWNTLLYAGLTSFFKVVIAFFIALYLTSDLKSKDFIRSMVFFPNLVSSLAVGITFAALMHPMKGLFNVIIQGLGGDRISFLGDPNIALYSIIFTDVWKGLSISVVIYIGGLMSINRDYYEAAAIDGASKWQQIRHISFPLVAPAMNSIIILSLIGGLRSFDLIWSMTKGGPGFATDVLASVIYKQYAAGFYGLSTAGNVIMLVLIAVIIFPLQHWLQKREEQIAL